MRNKYFNNSRPVVKTMKNKEKVELIGKTFDLIVTLTMMYMHDKVDLNPDQLLDYYSKATTWIEEIGEDRISLEDVKQMLLEETGIDMNVMYRN